MALPIGYGVSTLNDSSVRKRWLLGGGWNCRLDPGDAGAAEG